MKRIVILLALLCLFLSFQGVFAADNPPSARTGLVYDGTKQLLLNPGTPAGNYCYWDPNPPTAHWGKDQLPAVVPGTYHLYYAKVTGDGNCPSGDYKQGSEIIATIAKNTNDPEPIEGLKYTGKDQFLVTEAGTVNSRTYYFRLKGEQWSKERPTGKDAGSYIVEYGLGQDPNTPNDDAVLSYTVTIGGSQPQPQPPQPQPEKPDPIIPFYQIGDGFSILNGEYDLPATGFPTRMNLPLSVRPEGINYTDLGMRIQIPSLGVDVQMNGVPVVDNTWVVEWLGGNAGLLSGSAIPGEGISLVAAHNHLNAEESGPFLMLFSLEQNDRIFVNKADGTMEVFKVFANELLEPNDMERLAAIASQENNSLVLVTCENESVDGRYLNRRVVFAKPIA